MNYHEAVTQAAAALTRGEDANWELARLTYENTVTGTGARPEPGKVTMEQWCVDVREASGRRFATRTGKTYKAVWSRYGLGRAGGEGLPTWIDAYLEVNGATAPSEEHFAAVKANAVITHGSLEVKRDIAAKLLTDPVVADAVLQEPEMRRAVYDALNRREQAAEQRREVLTNADPISREIDQMRALADISARIEQWTRDLAQMMRRLGPLPDSERDPFANRLFIEQVIARHEEVLASLKAYLTTGKTDLDAFLDSVLQGRN